MNHKFIGITVVAAILFGVLVYAGTHNFQAELVPSMPSPQNAPVTATAPVSIQPKTGRCTLSGTCSENGYLGSCKYIGGPPCDYFGNQ